MTLLMWTALIVTSASLMWALSAFDQLLEVASAELKALRIGEPDSEAEDIRGVRGKAFRRGLARNRLFVKWIFKTPCWARELPIARRLVRRLRVGSTIVFVGLGAFSVGVFLGV